MRKADTTTILNIHGEPVTAARIAYRLDCSSDNARTMAAAPALLDALKETVAFLEDAIAADVLSADEFSDNGLLSTALDAIARAEGR